VQVDKTLNNIKLSLLLLLLLLLLCIIVHEMTVQLRLQSVSLVWAEWGKYENFYSGSGAVDWSTALQAGRLRVRLPMVSLEFFIDIILPATLSPWGYSTSNRNWVPGIFPWCKEGRCVGLTTLPPSCADRLEIWEPYAPGTLRASPGREDSIQFYSQQTQTFPSCPQRTDWLCTFRVSIKDVPRIKRPEPKPDHWTLCSAWVRTDTDILVNRMSRKFGGLEIRCGLCNSIVPCVALSNIYCYFCYTKWSYLDFRSLPSVLHPSSSDRLTQWC
jgi:hypothetical protein